MDETWILSSLPASTGVSWSVTEWALRHGPYGQYWLGFARIIHAPLHPHPAHHTNVASPHPIAPALLPPCTFAVFLTACTVFTTFGIVLARVGRPVPGLAGAVRNLQTAKKVFISSTS